MRIVEREPIQSYVYLGGAERYLEDVSDGWPVHGEGHVLFNLKAFLDDLDSLGLSVTARAAQQTGLRQLKDELEETADDAKLTEDQVDRLTSEMRKLRITLFAESSGKVAFIVTDKRHDSDKLLDSPGDLFTPGVFDELGEELRYDIEEAGKCIAFERSTAAAFHLMRATEGAVRDLYCAVVKRKADRVDPLLWHPMVAHLRERSKPPPRPLLDQLDNIRHNFRNPTQHPDAIYDIQEAQDLLALAIDAITRSVRAMP